MTLTHVDKSVRLTAINCGVCGGTYAINERYRQQKYEDGGSWNCPYCKTGWGFSNDNENAKLKHQLKNEQKRRQWAEHNLEHARENEKHANHRANGYKGQLVKTKKRIKHGVCPCCTRSFKNLASHMANKHPEYNA